MTTPRNSMVGAFPAEPLKGPIAMHAAQKVVPRRVPVVVGPTQSFFMREAKALGVSQSPCIPHPRDSLASGSSCYRPGTGFNMTRRYLIQHEVFFMSDMGCGAGGWSNQGCRDYCGLCSPAPILRLAQLGASIPIHHQYPSIPAMEMPGWWGK